MTDSKRYLPEKQLPRYIFVPGESPHPKKDGGHMEGEGDPVLPVIDPLNPQDHEGLRYALDLFNHTYFWESHVYFEAIWNAHGRKDATSDFMKAMIKLGAGGVKLMIKEPTHARDHFLRARELFLSVKEKKGDPFLGFSLSEIIKKIDHMLTHELTLFEIHPLWKS